MTPHIAQRSVQEFMTFYLHILITDSPRYFDGGEAVKQTNKKRATQNVTYYRSIANIVLNLTTAMYPVNTLIK